MTFMSDCESRFIAPKEALILESCYVYIAKKSLTVQLGGTAFTTFRRWPELLQG